jgi:hypothetical protein
MVNTVQCDSICKYVFIALTCFVQLTNFRWHKIKVIRNYYYEVRNTHVKVFI